MRSAFEVASFVRRFAWASDIENAVAFEAFITLAHLPIELCRKPIETFPRGRLCRYQRRMALPQESASHLDRVSTGAVATWSVISMRYLLTILTPMVDQVATNAVWTSNKRPLRSQATISAG